MKLIGKLAIGAVMAGAAALATTAPADARVTVGIGIGGPGYYGYYGPAYYHNPCWRPYPYRPYYCDAGYYPGYYGYGGPVIGLGFGGGWGHGGWHGGHGGWSHGGGAHGGGHWHPLTGASARLTATAAASAAVVVCR